MILSRIKTNKCLYISLLLLFISYISTQSAFAQIFDTEQAPPSVKWRQISTPDFQLIFPSAFENEAQKLAQQLTHIQHLVGRNLKIKPRKISIVLQNQTVVSNGFVQLAPRKSEWFTTPPQQNDFQDWLHQLAVHELRHVVQIDKLTGTLKAPFFEQLAFAIYGVTLPTWFFEGDAVVTETVHSPSGRGRLPSWEMPLRTNLLSGAHYRYQKNYLGSFKDLTSGYYQLGYFMVAKLQRDHGTGVLDSIMRRMARNPVRPYNFSNSLRKFTGYNTRRWYQQTMDELTTIWQQQREANQPENYPILPSKTTRSPESWLLPQALPNGDIIALHQSPKQAPAIVILDQEGSQREIVKIGQQTTPNLSYAAGIITWDEIRRHSRYGRRTYSVINIFDLKTRTYKQLTRKSRLFSPALHPSGAKVAAIEIGWDNKVQLVLLQTTTGKIIERIPAPHNMMLQTPAFDASGTKIITVGVTREGTALMEFNSATRQFRQLTDWQAQQLERPSYINNRIIFKAHYNGIDNIYSLNPADSSIAALTNVAFGAFNPWFDAMTNKIWFNNYQSDGYKISWLPATAGTVTYPPKKPNSRISYFKPLLTNITNPTHQDTINPLNVASTSYNEVKNLINFHSLSVDPGDFSDFATIKPGLYWLSDNLLNTAQLRLGYRYDGNTRSSEYMASATYQRYFPKFSLEYRNRGQVTAMSTDQSGSKEISRVRWREHVSTLRMEIPLVFYRRNHIYTAGLEAATSYTSRYHLSDPQFTERFIHRVKFPLSYRISFGHQVRQSQMDLAPRWGQYISLSYRHLPTNNRLTGTHLSLRSAFYLPGAAPNHSFLARFNYQKGSGTFQHVNDIPLVSGYDQLAPIPVTNTLLLSYRFPIAYPDWSVGPLAYIKRLKGGFFTDFQNIQTGNSFRPRTVGLELRSDMNLLRFY